MASPLDSLIKNEVAKGFKGRLKKGTIRKETLGSGVDSFGDPSSSTFTTHSFEGIRDDFSAFYKSANGIPQTDVRILVLLGSTSVNPVQGDQVLIEGDWHKVVQERERDPAGATVALQCSKIKDPT